MDKIDFIHVNCTEHISICNENQIYQFPTTNIYLKGKEILEKPEQDLESMLEFFDKLTTKSVIELYDYDNLEDFSIKYGDISFLIIDDSKNTDFYRCVEKLAEMDYKTQFYFGFLETKEYKNEYNLKIPGLIVSSHCLFKFIYVYLCLIMFNYV